MGKGGFKPRYKTIDFALTEIAEEFERHGYDLIPEEAYQAWINLGTFRGEESAVVRGRDRFIAHFEDEDGREWDIATYKCIKNIHFSSKDANWRFVEHIKCDGKVFAKPKITIAAYEKLVREAQKKTEERVAYYRRYAARWFVD